jgi:hypothetical protein
MPSPTMRSVSVNKSYHYSLQIDFSPRLSDTHIMATPSIHLGTVSIKYSSFSSYHPFLLVFLLHNGPLAYDSAPSSSPLQYLAVLFTFSVYNRRSECSSDRGGILVAVLPSFSRNLSMEYEVIGCRFHVGIDQECARDL